jgi:hypothetical protein
VHVAPAAQFIRGSLTDITIDVKSHARPVKKDDDVVSNVTEPASVLIEPTLIDSGVVSQTADDNDTETKQSKNLDIRTYYLL